MADIFDQAAAPPAPDIWDLAAQPQKPSDLLPHPDHVDQATTASARAIAEQVTRPIPQPVEAPSFADRLKSGLQTGWDVANTHAIKALGGSTATELWENAGNSAKDLIERTLGEPWEQTRNNLPAPAHAAEFLYHASKIIPGIVDFLFTPLGAATVASSGAPPAVKAGAEAYFGTQMAKGTAESYQRFKANPSPASAGELASAAAGTVLPLIHAAGAEYGNRVRAAYMEKLRAPEQQYTLTGQPVRAEGGDIFDQAAKEEPNVAQQPTAVVEPKPAAEAQQKEQPESQQQGQPVAGPQPGQQQSAAAAVAPKGKSLPEQIVDLRTELGRDPTGEEIQREFGLSKGEAKRSLDSASLLFEDLPKEAASPEKTASASAVIPVEESPQAKYARDLAGHTQIVRVNAQAFQDQFEKSHGGPLPWNEERAARLKDLPGFDAYPQVTGEGGKVDVIDGRHRIAEAARRGADIDVAVKPGTELPPEVQSVAEKPQSVANGSTPRHPATTPAYGRDVNVAVPGEQTAYPARYAIRESTDVQPSHNAFSFEKNPNYEHQNDRDYRNAGNAARVAEQAAAFDPSYVTMESPTAEHGAPVIDPNGNVLGGNSRTMTLGRVYESNPRAAEAYKAALRDRAASLGLKPEDVDRFQRPVLVRETTGQYEPQKAISDFNKAGAAALSPHERAVKDGKRLSPQTVQQIGAQIGDVGEGGTLAQAMRGDGGAEIVNALVKDGVLTPQEANGLVDERGQLTGEAKDRVAKMLVGRLYDSPAEMQATPPELRNKLERVAPQVLRVEGRNGWSLTDQTREAVSALADARAHGIKNLGDLAKQGSLNGEAGKYSPEALAIARKMQEGPVAAERAFRQYANDEQLSREEGQTAFFEPPTREETFQAAFGEGVQLARDIHRPLDTLDARRPGQVYRDADWDLRRPGTPGRSSLLKLNRQAAILVSDALGPRTRGGYADPAAAQDLAGQIEDDAQRRYRDKEIDLPALTRAHQLADQIRDASQSRRGVSFYESGGHLQLPAVMGTIRHELLHDAQASLAARYPAEKVAAFHADVAASPAARVFAPVLSRMGGYDVNSPETLANEAASHLLSGGGREMGVNDGVALSFARDYYRALEKHFGPEEAKNAMRYARGKYKMGVSDAATDTSQGRGPGRAEASTDQGPPAIAGEPQGGGGGPGDQRVRHLEEGRGQGTSGGNPETGGRPGGGPKLSRSNDPGLFDPDTERQSQVDAQRGADRLLGDRLTAQIKSGLAAKPTKLKPAESGGLFDEDKPEQGKLFLSRVLDVPAAILKADIEEMRALKTKRDAGLAAMEAAKETPGEKAFGEKVRTYFTGERDLWASRVNQVIDRLRKLVPDASEQEALSLMREFRLRPNEMEKFLDGTHAALATLNQPQFDLAMKNINRLRPSILKALNPTPRMLDADKVLTTIADGTLREGQRLGFLDSRWTPEEYVTHLLHPKGEGDVATPRNDPGQQMGGKIGKFFAFALRRSDPYPTLLHAVADNVVPKTLNAFDAFTIHGDKFATARATHLLEHQLADTGTGVYAVKENAPEGWVPLAPQSDEFRKLTPYTNEEGEPDVAEKRLWVPRFVEAALKPITDPNYGGKIIGFTKLRVYQAYLKAAQLGLSLFHATTENYMALANMGPKGWIQGLRADRADPDFLKAERDFIIHDGTTAIQGKTTEAYRSLQPGSIPTWQDIWKRAPVLREADELARKVTDFTFGKMQRQFKVTDYQMHTAAWMADHPNASAGELADAKRSVAKEVNAVYGGLNTEALGINRTSMEVARALMLAPDWTFSNIFNVKYAMEKGSTPAGKLARAFWTRQIVGGIAATQLASLMFSGKLSPQLTSPGGAGDVLKGLTQVYMGNDPQGQEIHQNLFFKGAGGDVLNLINQVHDYGAVEGLGRTVAGKAAPVIRTGLQTLTNRDYLGGEIVPKGMNPIAATVRGAYNIGKGLAPVPMSGTTLRDMLIGPGSEKYTMPEYFTVPFSGNPPHHTPPAGMRMTREGLVPAHPRENQSIWDEITSGKR